MAPRPLWLRGFVQQVRRKMAKREDYGWWRGGDTTRSSSRWMIGLEGEGRDVVVASAPMIGKRVLLDAAIWRGFVDGRARLSSALPEIYMYCTTVFFLDRCGIFLSVH